MTQKPQKKPSPYLKFTSIAFQMGAAIWLGNLLGTWLDTRFATSYWESVITLFAVFASMYLVISQVLKMSKDDD